MKILITFLLAFFTITGYSQIKKFNESASKFGTIKLDSSRGVFQYKDMYRAYMKAGTGFMLLAATAHGAKATPRFAPINTRWNLSTNFTTDTIGTGVNR